jgi:hypothetical protein
MLTRYQTAELRKWKADTGRNRESQRSIAKRLKISRSTARYWDVPTRSMDPVRRETVSERAKTIISCGFLTGRELATKLGCPIRTATRWRTRVLGTAKKFRAKHKKAYLKRQRKATSVPLPTRFASYRNIWA